MFFFQNSQFVNTTMQPKAIYIFFSNKKGTDLNSKQPN